MKKRNSALTFIIAGVFAIIISCKKDPVNEHTKTVYLDVPESSRNNSLFNLGRVLFYDTHLSINNSISCGSCHNQSRAFSDNKSFSLGFENKATLRNAPPIQNLGDGFFFFGSDTSFFITHPFTPNDTNSNLGQGSLFWDGRERFLPSMVLKPIVNHVEMGMNDNEEIINRVKKMSYYPELFLKAFKSTDIDLNKIASALAAFTGSISSTNTRFDKEQSGKIKFASLEMEGKNLFFHKYNCNKCHKTDFPGGYHSTATTGGFFNIGLDINYKDNGLGDITKRSSDKGKFRVPNLRNIALTAPYMHDGRFATLEDVLNHYKHGIADHPNLDPLLKGPDNRPLEMNISDMEKKAIIAFLNTLTDFDMITNPSFSNPFKVQ